MTPTNQTAAAVLAGLKPGDRVEINRHGAWTTAEIRPWLWGWRLLFDDGSQIGIFHGYEEAWPGRMRPAQQQEATDGDE